LKHVLQRLLAIGFGILFALLIAEGAVRLAGTALCYPIACASASLEHIDASLGNLPSPHSEGYLVGPDFTITTHINGDSLRDRDVGPKMPGTRRIMVYGDSFTWGWGVADDQTIPRQLEMAIQAGNSACPTDVVNAGEFAWGPAQSLALYDKLDRSYSPDVVVLAVIGGDVLRNGDRYMKLLWPDGPYGAGDSLASTVVRGVHNTLAGRLQLYLALSNAFARIPGLRAATFRLGLRPTDDAGGDVGSSPNDPALVEGARRTQQVLARWRETAQQRGEVFALALLPEKADATLGEASENVALAKLIDTARAEHIPTIDVFGAVAAGGGAALYFPHDGHPTPGGDAVIAGDLARQLQPLFDRSPCGGH
jgi:lysophospholipase L1-like esterase